MEYGKVAMTHVDDLCHVVMKSKKASSLFVNHYNLLV